jgi:hypothetical protein
VRLRRAGRVCGQSPEDGHHGPGPSTCAAAAATSARSWPWATAPPGSGAWLRTSTPTPRTSPTTHITDTYHAREHLHDLAAHLAFITPDPPQWLEDRKADLDAGNIDAIIEAASCYSLAGVKADELERKLGYFRNNAHRMRYQHFRDLGMLAGSGAIEGGIKAIVVQRAKQAGMHWSVSGAASILALRTQHASGRWNDFIAPEHTPPAAGLRTGV